MVENVFEVGHVISRGEQAIHVSRCYGLPREVKELAPVCQAAGRGSDGLAERRCEVFSLEFVKCGWDGQIGESPALWVGIGRGGRA